MKNILQKIFSHENWLALLLALILIALAIFSRWLVWLPGVIPLGVVAVCILFRVVTPDSFGRPKKPVIF